MTTFPLIAGIGQLFSMLLLGGMAIFLILLVLVQRGRGGGLAGALGGMGGSSAFGAKAGDVFTKITAASAFIWIVLCIATAKMTPSEDSLINTNVTSSAPATSGGPALTAPVDEEAEGADTSEASTEAPAGDEPAPDAE